MVNEMTNLSSKESSHIREMITDPTAPIEEKGMELRHVKNVANFIFISNVVHKDLFPDIGTNARRIAHYTCRNVIKDPAMWDRFWEWAGGQNVNNSTTRQICAGSLALADYLYRRRVTRQFNVLPKDDHGVTAGLSALPDVHQWWY